MVRDNLFKILSLLLVVANEETTVDTESQIANVQHQLHGMSYHNFALFDSCEFNTSQVVLERVRKAAIREPHNCVEAFDRAKGSGIYQIYMPQLGLVPISVYCLADPNHGAAWTVILRRVDGSTDFYRDWSEYRRGFGKMKRNFFIGLETLHILTTKGEVQELWVQLEDNVTAHAKYNRFAIGDESEKFALTVVGDSSGDAGDALWYSKGLKFSTRDSNNAGIPRNCAIDYHGAWWYNDCSYSNLNGLYGSSELAKGINWWSFRGHRVSMKYAHMAIRPSTS